MAHQEEVIRVKTVGNADSREERNIEEGKEGVPGE